LSRSTILFSTTVNGDVFMTGLITSGDLMDLSAADFRLLMDNKTPLHEKLMVIALIFEGEQVDGEAVEELHSDDSREVPDP